MYTSIVVGCLLYLWQYLDFLKSVKGKRLPNNERFVMVVWKSTLSIRKSTKIVLKIRQIKVQFTCDRITFYSAHWFRNVKIDQQFKNSKNIDFRENIVKQEMSIYAKAKSLLICTIDVWPLLHMVWRIFRGFFLIITVKLHRCGYVLIKY